MVISGDPSGCEMLPIAINNDDVRANYLMCIPQRVSKVHQFQNVTYFIIIIKINNKYS